jgi:SpoVK/Ycf46/Vps4 family AAA+-type ATPase
MFAAHFINVSIADLLRGEVGESERVLSSIFSTAKQCSPCVIFFDEFQAVFSRRESAGTSSSKLISQLLIEMDLLNNESGHVKDPTLSTIPSVTVMAATNVPQAIDSAVLRPGRIDRTIYIGMFACFIVKLLLDRL